MLYTSTVRRVARQKSRHFGESLQHAGRGFFVAVLLEANIRRQLALLLVVVVAAWWVNLSLLEVLVVLMLSVLVIATELMNSSLEALADAVHPDFSEHIQRAKDMSAAAVLLMSLFALLVGLAIFIPRIIFFFG